MFILKLSWTEPHPVSALSNCSVYHTVSGLSNSSVRHFDSFSQQNITSITKIYIYCISQWFWQGLFTYFPTGKTKPLSWCPNTFSHCALPVLQPLFCHHLSSLSSLPPSFFSAPPLYWCPNTFSHCLNRIKPLLFCTPSLSPSFLPPSLLLYHKDVNELKIASKN